jgi:Na+/H+ antiporter NhaD/arsenite permease-like protein
MEHAGVLALIGEGIGALVGMGPRVGAGLLLVSAALTSSVTDNIPLAAVLANILSGAQTDPQSPLWWCVIFGANLGGNLTPIGSASTVVAVTLMHKSELKVSFFGFVRQAAPFALAQIALSALYVLLFL